MNGLLRVPFVTFARPWVRLARCTVGSWAPPRTRLSFPAGRAGPSGVNGVGRHRRRLSISRIHAGECQYVSSILICLAAESQDTRELPSTDTTSTVVTRWLFSFAQELIKRRLTDAISSSATEISGSQLAVLDPFANRFWMNSQTRSNLFHCKERVVHHASALRGWPAQ
jgi:hypothetical protein